jgi:hypothetical protein
VTVLFVMHRDPLSFVSYWKDTTRLGSGFVNSSAFAVSIESPREA